MTPKKKDDQEVPDDEGEATPETDEVEGDEDPVSEDDQEAVEEIDLDALIDARVEERVSKILGLDEEPTDRESDRSQGAASEKEPGSSSGSEGGGDSGSPASPPSDIDDAVRRVLDERDLKGRIERLENPSPPEKKKRRGIAWFAWGG